MPLTPAEEGRVIEDLAAGLGTEDISVKRKLDLEDIRKFVAYLRKRAMVRAIIKPKGSILERGYKP